MRNQIEQDFLSLPLTQVILCVSSHLRKGPQFGNPMPQVSPSMPAYEKNFENNLDLGGPLGTSANLDLNHSEK